VFLLILFCQRRILLTLQVNYFLCVLSTMCDVWIVAEYTTQLRHFMKQMRNFLRRKWQLLQLPNGDFNFLPHCITWSPTTLVLSNMPRVSRGLEELNTSQQNIIDHMLWQKEQRLSLFLYYSCVIPYKDVTSQGWIQCEEKTPRYRHLQGENLLEFVLFIKWFVF